MEDRKSQQRKLTGGGVAHSIPGLLSEREMELLKLVGEGCGNEEIARELNIAPTTVRNGIVRICSKLGLDSRYKLISYAAKRGIMMDTEGETDTSDDTA